jgi:hypothetical protein
VQSSAGKSEALLSSDHAQSALADEVYLSYARRTHPWLYEIYKVGGMTIEEFRSRVKAKMEGGDSDAGAGAGGPTGTLANAAFANLNKELNKKFKK